MRLSWNEIRSRAAAFARKWEGAGYEKGETQLFYRDFFDVFDMSVRRVATFEEPVKLLGDFRTFELYDLDLMPPNLRKAHQALDRAVDRLYRRSGFATERERVEYLLGLYEKMMVPLVAKGVRGRRR